MKTLAWLLLLSFFGFCVPAGGEIYRWIGEDGKPHFGDKLPEGAKGAESFQGKAAVSFMGGGNGTAKKPTAKVRIFLTQSCPYCKKAKAYLHKRGTPFEELDVEASRSAKLEYDKLKGHGVPVILVGEQRMNGFNEADLESLLVGVGL